MNNQPDKVEIALEKLTKAVENQHNGIKALDNCLNEGFESWHTHLNEIKAIMDETDKVFKETTYYIPQIRENLKELSGMLKSIKSKLQDLNEK